MYRSVFWSIIVFASVVSGGFFLHDNTSEFLKSTVQTTLDSMVPLSQVLFPSVVVCNINQIRKSLFNELGFYDNETLVRIMYEDFIKGTKDNSENATYLGSDYPEEDDDEHSLKRKEFYQVEIKIEFLKLQELFIISCISVHPITLSSSISSVVTCNYTEMYQEEPSLNLRFTFIKTLCLVESLSCSQYSNCSILINLNCPQDIFTIPSHFIILLQTEDVPLYLKDLFQVLRNYLISKNISVNTSIIWLSHQVDIYL